VGARVTASVDPLRAQIALTAEQAPHDKAHGQST